MTFLVTLTYVEINSDQYLQLTRLAFHVKAKKKMLSIDIYIYIYIYIYGDYVEIEKNTLKCERIWKLIHGG